MAQAKARGIVLGGNGRELAEQNRRDAIAFAKELMPEIDRIGSGLPLAHIARALNQGGFRTRRGRRFNAQTITDVIRRAGDIRPSA